MRTATVPGLAAILVLGATACGESAPDREAPGVRGGAVPAAAESGVEARETLHLIEIMRGLETDLADVAHGLWVEDPETVRAAAGRIASHPKVPPEQMAAIRSELGDRFAAFAAMDRHVHDASVALAEAARTGAEIGELFARYQRIEEGCLGCHAAFRSQVRDALRPDAESPTGG